MYLTAEYDNFPVMPFVLLLSKRSAFILDCGILGTPFPLLHIDMYDAYDNDDE